MRIRDLPNETVVELLYYLAENEAFSTVEKIPGGGITPAMVSAVLRQLADELKKESASKSPTSGLTGNEYLTNDARKILSALSPREEERLLKILGLDE